MAFTYERKIDALGGTPSSQSDYDVAYNEGHGDAVAAATEIGADADTMIGELIEVIEDILQMRRLSMATWATDAETLLRRIKGRTA